MLFSNDLVARYINARFEPAWEMVREVPLVRIDFGGGRVLTRTLHGNVLTSVCAADGTLLDALPGIYNPSDYLDQLNQLRLLHETFALQPLAQRPQWLQHYHARQVQRLAANQPAEGFAEKQKELPITKRAIELPAEQLIVAAKSLPTSGSGHDAMQLSQWKELEQDTRLNETTRRRQIHELLAQRGLVRPQEVTRPIYRTVLLADLDDPYLGLRAALFANYPFAQEDGEP